MPNKITVAIVSPYPSPNKKHIYDSGVSSYSKNLVENFGKYEEIEVHVISSHNRELPSVYTENKIMIHRVYDRNLLYILQIFKELCNIRPDIVHIQHEYFLYGGAVSAMLFPLLLFLSRIVSLKVVVTIHGVLPLKLIDDDRFRQENGITGPRILLKFGLFLVTKAIGIISHRIVVHEEFLKKRLVKDYKINAEKILVIPHGVENIKPISKKRAKKILGFEGKKVILFFGYLTGYKGLERLLGAYEKIAPKIAPSILLIAGGHHPRLRKSQWYKQWIQKIKSNADDIQKKLDKKGEITFTGYVSEEELKLYYSVADVVVLPYTWRIAASGPESLAIAFEKPFLISGFSTSHFSIFHFRDTEELIKKIQLVLRDKQYRLDALKQVKSLKKQRDWHNISKKHLQIYMFMLGG